MKRKDKIESLMKAFLQLKRSMNRQLEEGDACAVTPVQTEIMARIRRRETYASDIATSMQSSPSSVTQHINQLVELGHVKRTESARDKRRMVLSLTATGKGVIDKKIVFMRKRVETLVTNLSDEELDQFVHLSNKIAVLKAAEE